MDGDQEMHEMAPAEDAFEEPAEEGEAGAQEEWGDPMDPGRELYAGQEGSPGEEFPLAPPLPVGAGEGELEGEEAEGAEQHEDAEAGDMVEGEEVEEEEEGDGLSKKERKKRDKALKREEEENRKREEKDRKKEEKKQKKLDKQRRKEEREQEERERERRMESEEEGPGNEEEDEEEDDDEAERKRRQRQKAKRERFTCVGWLTNLAQEIGFSAWFRVYVLYLLFCNLTFVTLLGYHFMMASGYRMIVPPVASKFFVSFAMLCTFFVALTLFNTFIYLNVRLIVGWLGMTRESCNLFFLPNQYEDPGRAVRLRDFQLLLLEVAVVLVPLVYAILQTIGDGDLITAFVGHFSFVAFVAFGILFSGLWMYTWVRSIRSKSKAWRQGNRLLKAAKQAEGRYGEDSDEYDESEEEEESEEDSDDGRKKKDKKKKGKKSKRRDDDTSDDEEEDEYDRKKKSKKKKSRRRDDSDSEEEDRRGRRGSPRRKKSAKKRKGGGEDGEKRVRVPWHRRKLANPLVMSEFGVDLFSTQAYVLHCFVGVVWLVVVSYPVGISGNIPIEWLAITAVTLVGGLFMQLQMGPSKTRAKKIATRQRHTTLVMMTVWSLFMLIGVIAAFAAAMTWAGLMLLVMLAMTQLMTVRRHDMHVRDSGEAGAMFLPLSNREKQETRRWQRWGKPSLWIPVIPCGNVLRTCFKRGCCTEPAALNADGTHDGEPLLLSGGIGTGMPAGHGPDGKKAGSPGGSRPSPDDAAPATDDAAAPAATVVVTMDQRDGRGDRIVRPMATPGYKLAWADSEYAKTAKGKMRLGREVYLNRRERVLTADAMVTTWYFMFFLILLGVVYGYGEWLQPQPGHKPPPVSGGAVGGDRPYPVCGMGGVGGLWEKLTVQDFAFLTYHTLRLAEYGATDVGTSPEEWFPNSLQVRLLSTAADDEGYQASRGFPVSWAHYEVVAGANAEVVVLHGKDPWKEWMRDVDTWGEAALYQLLGALNPFFALWPASAQEGMVRALGLVKKGMEEKDELALVESFVRARLQSTNTTTPIYLTGHGPYAGWAKLLWQRMKGGGSEAVARLDGVVAFAPPGTRWTGERMGSPALTNSNEVSVVPRRAALSLIDRHSGFVQETDCDASNSITDCQSMDVLLCELLKSCGGSKSYEGFDPSQKCKA